MSAHNSTPDTSAAAWMTRRDAGWSATEQAAFQAWLDASPENLLAWAKVEAAWQVLDRPRHDGMAQAFLRRLAVRQRRRALRRYAFGSMGLAAAAGLAAMLLVAPVEPAADASVGAKPQLVQSPQQILPDGSVVDLNRNAEIVVEYDSARRAVRLVRGEAHFDVKPEAARPFVVTASGVDVRAVGTAFAVRIEPGAVDVLVTKGRVAVETPAEAASASDSPLATVMMSAGDRVSMPTAAVTSLPRPEPISEAEIARRLYWRGPRLELSGTTLADAIAILNLKSSVRVTIRDADLAQMRMSGVFRADDLEGFVDVLVTNYGAVVERHGNEIVLRRGESR